MHREIVGFPLFLVKVLFFKFFSTIAVAMVDLFPFLFIFINYSETNYII